MTAVKLQQDQQVAATSPDRVKLPAKVVDILHEAYQHHADMALHYLRSRAFSVYDERRALEHIAKASQIHIALWDAGADGPGLEARAVLSEAGALMRRAEWPNPHTT